MQLLENVVLADGTPAHVIIAGETITRVGRGPAPRDLDAGIARLDLRGYVLLAAPVEPHAHLDRARLSDRRPADEAANEAGPDLAGAVAAVRRLAASESADDIRQRARQVATTAIERGFTAVRTHVDCRSPIGTRAVEVLSALRVELTGVLTLQLVALTGAPLTGAAGRPQRDELRAALAAGADLVGGTPAHDPDPAAAIGELLAAARDAGCGLDLHVDETTRPEVLTLSSLATQVRDSAFPHRVTASHCISLGAQPPDRTRRLASELADAGIAVVTLPQTSLYLQDRGPRTPQRRGLTAVADLRAAGVTVAAGGDNWRDPVNPLGHPDPLRTAALLVLTAHLSAADAYRAVSEDARTVLGLPAVQVQAGHRADLLAVRGCGLEDVLATCTQDRLVFRGGQLVVRTRVTDEWFVPSPLG